MIDQKENVLLVIDYQKAFKNNNSVKTIKIINKLARMYKWDKVIETMWFNSGEESNLYMQNLGYDACKLEDADAGLVKMFPATIVLPRINRYSCCTDDFFKLINYNMNIYVAGWETDACVLGTLFSLFDNGVNFTVVSEAVTSETDELDMMAKKIIERQFGNVLMSYESLPIEKKKLFCF